MQVHEHKKGTSVPSVKCNAFFQRYITSDVLYKENITC